jgi:hypothetical protein
MMPHQAPDGLTKISDIYALGDSTGRWYLPRVVGFLILEDMFGFPDCYSMATRTKYLGMARKWGISANDLPDQLGRGLGPSLGFRKFEPLPTIPPRRPDGAFLQRPPWLKGSPPSPPPASGLAQARVSQYSNILR